MSAQKIKSNENLIMWKVWFLVVVVVFFRLCKKHYIIFIHSIWRVFEEKKLKNDTRGGECKGKKEKKVILFSCLEMKLIGLSTFYVYFFLSFSSLQKLKLHYNIIGDTHTLPWELNLPFLLNFHWRKCCYTYSPVYL